MTLSVRQLRKLANADREAKIELTDDQIEAIRDQHEDEEPDTIVEAIVEANDTPVDEPADDKEDKSLSAMGSNEEENAVTLAGKLPKEFDDYRDTVVVAQGTLNATVLRTMHFYEVTFGEDFPSIFPAYQSGPAKKEDRSKFLTNTTVDYYWKNVDGANGGKVLRRYSWFRTHVEATNRGSLWASQLAGVKMAQDKNRRDKAPEEYRKMKPFQRKNFRRKTEQALNRLKSDVRNAIQLSQQLELLSTCKLIKWRLVQESGQDPMGNKFPDYTSPTPIVLSAKHVIKGSDGKEETVWGDADSWSVSDVIRMDIQGAIDKANGKDKVTLENITETIGRETRTTETLSIGDLDQFEDFMLALVNYIPDHSAAITTWLASLKGDERKTTVLTIGKAAIWMDTVFGKVKPEYQRYMADEVAKAGKIKAAAKAAEEAAAA